MEKDYLIYLDGDLVPSEEAKVSVFDHGLLYGDGVFEGIRAYEGVVFQMDAHLNRLYQSAKAIRISIPLTKDALKEAVLETLRQNELKNAYIRLLVTRGKGSLGIDPTSCPKASIIIITRPVDPLHGADARRRGISTIIAATRRNPPDTTSHEIKSLNYLNSILGRLEAIAQGVDDAILLDHRGFIAEATVTTLFVVRNGQLHTPPLHASILDSITRRFIIAMARDLNLTVTEDDLTLFQLRNADEVFFCGTYAEMIPVASIDGQPVGTVTPGPITQQLMDAFTERRKDPQYGTPIYVSAKPSTHTSR